jgi:hypothetical protein
VRAFACISWLLSLGALSACPGRGLSIGGDGRLDMSTNTPDFGADGCKQIGMWPTDIAGNLNAYFTPASNEDDASLEALSQPGNANGNVNIFYVEIDVPPGVPPPYPAMVSFSKLTSLLTPAWFGPNAASQARVFVYENCDLTVGCHNVDFEWYVPQAGTLTMAEVDDSPSGTMAVSASNLHFLQWMTDLNAPDVPIPNGKCLDIGSFNASVAYAPSAAPDFGVPVDLAPPIDLSM